VDRDFAPQRGETGRGARVLREKEDIFHLTLQGFHDVVRTSQVDDELIQQR